MANFIRVKHSTFQSEVWYNAACIEMIRQVSETDIGAPGSCRSILFFKGTKESRMFVDDTVEDIIAQINK